jgi:predicted nucleic acid-binding protein
MSVLIDTSAWIEALRKDGNPAIQSQVKHILLTGEAATCSMIMLELWNGAKGDYERSQLRRLTETLTFLDIDADVWRESWDLAKKCRAEGITIPSTDLLIIAVSLRYNAQIVHADKHFDLFHRS